jgi:hypothetical protein
VNALTSTEVLTLWGIAKADRRLDRRDRITVCAVARAGRVETKTIALVTGQKDHRAVRDRLNRLVDLGYLPPAVKR